MKFSTWLASLTEKTVPADGDLVVVLDSAASNAPKKMQKSNLVGAGTGGGIDPSGWQSADAMTYASADDPTFTMTCSGDQTGKYSPGMRVKLTQTTTKYFIITAVAYTSVTTLTLYGGTDYDLVDAAITTPYYSVCKAPVGFPLDPTKWTVEVTNTNNNSQATPTENIWYNLGSITISIPVGAWSVSYHAALSGADASASGFIIRATLSTANNSESDADFTTVQYNNASLHLITTVNRAKTLVLTSKTAYYLNLQCQSINLDNLQIRGDLSKTIIRAACAYL